jgi:hypothetical protein
MKTTRISRLDTEALLQHFQDDCEVMHVLQIERDDLLDERPVYVIWSLKFCRTLEDIEISEKVSSMASSGELRLHLDIMDPDEFDAWAVTSCWEGDAFPYGNCPLYYLALAGRVIDLDWRLDVIRNHREIADSLEASYLPTTVQ